MTSISDLRREYASRALVESEAQEDALRQFELWFKEALSASLVDANAMTLATASPSGEPSARIVLLKAVDERGFVFFTNYDSRKGRELAANPPPPTAMQESTAGQCHGELKWLDAQSEIRTASPRWLRRSSSSPTPRCRSQLSWQAWR